jgi:hypothetical protein
MVFIAFAAPKNADALVSWVTGPVFQPSERANRANFFVELIGPLWRDFSRTRFK